jgi:hypothetical protein
VVAAVLTAANVRVGLPSVSYVATYYTACREPRRHQMVPARCACGMTGHQACGFLLRLSVLKRQGKITEIPSVGRRSRKKPERASAGATTGTGSTLDLLFNLSVRRTRGGLPTQTGGCAAHGGRRRDTRITRQIAKPTRQVLPLVPHSSTRCARRLAAIARSRMAVPRRVGGAP